MNLFQRTLKRSVSCTGIGLHSGKRVNLKLRPAEADTGIVFKRTDLASAPLVPGDVHHVVDTSFCTTVAKDGVAVSTVEHLMSALAGLGVDNALVEVDAPEVPIMDGSAAPFVFLARNAGLTSQGKLRQFYQVTGKVTHSEGDKTVSVAPADNLRVDFTIEFDHPLINRQTMSYDLNERSYDQEISRARTFGFLKDFRALQDANLALGASLHNAVALDSYSVMNDDGLRFPDEFVRHKVLDFLGDLALVGRPILGAFTAFKSGHDLNNKLFRKFLADPTAWKLITPTPEMIQNQAATMGRPMPLFEQAVARA